MSLRRLLRSHLGPYGKLLGVVVILQAIQASAALTLPSLNADIIDKGVLVGDNDYIRQTGLLMLGFTLVQIVFAVGATWYGAKAAMSFGRDVRSSLFHRVLDYSAEEVGHFGAPSLITRITNDVQQVQIMVVTACTMMIAAPLTMVIGVIMAVRTDAGLSIVLVVSMPAAVLILGNVIRKMVPAFQLMQERVDRVNKVLREQITGIRVVRAFVREPEELARFDEANEDLTETALRTGRLMAAMFPTVMFIINASSILVLWIGADRIGAGDMQLGALVAYLSYLIQILMAVVMATFMMSMIPRAAVAAERIQEVLETETSIGPAASPISEVAASGSLEFRDVSFHYPGAEHPVLSNVSFAVRAGETTAVVGSTGSGKTTLVNLIPRLFDPTVGTVLVDDVDVRALDLDLLWSKVGYVPQRPYLFSGTVASNLRYGRPDATEEELWEALRVAQAEDFVRAMPDGLDSAIEQGGSNVSGGQRQRLSIARALIVRPEIYVFDDSFSALDLATDARLRAALAPQVEGAAVVIVAQRVSTIAGADQILVLEDGEVVGRGRHDDLLTSCPTYAEIVASQIGDGEEVPA
ncbi:MAG: ABC transporter ATP-binding protein [Acidimicrobiales bacterium]|nr:ABC transporter ATP-binding protein [Acidimicrobiales bacterium]